MWRTPITDAATLLDAGYKMEQTGALRNMPVVPDKSTARARLNGESAELHRAWYQGQVAKFFSFAEAPLAASGANVPLSPIYVTFNVNPGAPNGGPGSGFKAEPNSEQTHNVPFTLPGDPGYSPLWLVAVYDNADFPTVHDQGLGAQGQGAGSRGGDGQLPDRVRDALGGIIRSRPLKREGCHARVATGAAISDILP